MQNEPKKKKNAFVSDEKRAKTFLIAIVTGLIVFYYKSFNASCVCLYFKKGGRGETLLSPDIAGRELQPRWKGTK